MGARERLQQIDSELLQLRLERDGAWGTPPASAERRTAIEKQITEGTARRRRAQQEVEVIVSRDKARALRKAFREQFGALAQRYEASQSDRYPEEYRQREGDAIRREMIAAETQLSREILLWSRSLRGEAAQLRQQDPPLDAAAETRRLREQLEVASLAEQFPSKVQAQNFLLPQARAALQGGNVDRARVYFEAARRQAAHDGELERDIEHTLDRVVPHRRKAIELEVTATDELELSRRDIAQMKLVHRLGTPQEQARASTAVKMADFKREREAAFLKDESGIELPPATD